MRFLIVVLLSVGFAATAVAAGEAPVIRVTGTGEVAAEPDMATVTLGVTSQAKTAKAAMDETSAKTGAILAALRSAGIAETDLQTSDLSLDPVWSNRKYDSDSAPRIDGFTARNTVTVRVRALKGLGKVLDDVLNVGANSFQGVRFGLQEPQPVADQALQNAVQDAVRKAGLVAAAAGVSLGQIQSIQEGGGGSPGPVMMAEARMASVPVAAGEVSLTATVVVEFAIAQ